MFSPSEQKKNMEITSVHSGLVSPSSNSSEGVKKIESCYMTIYSIPSISDDVDLPDNIFNDVTKLLKASCTEKMKYLKSTDKLFIRPCSKPLIKQMNRTKGFEILNKNGSLIYFALDTTDAYNVMMDGAKPLNVVVVDISFKNVLEIESQPALDGYTRKITVKHNGKLLGKIIQEDHICALTPAFSIIDCNNIRVLRILGPPNSGANGLPSEPEFRVVLSNHSSSSMDPISAIVAAGTPPPLQPNNNENNQEIIAHNNDEKLLAEQSDSPVPNHVGFLIDDGKDLEAEIDPYTKAPTIGRITKQYLLFDNNGTGLVPADTYILTFHPDMDLRTKALLLASVFTIDFEFFHETVKGGVTPKCWIIFGIIFAALVIIILVGLYFIKEMHV